MLAPLLGRAALAWPAALAAIWAVGWAVTYAFGIQVDEQFTVFGSSGAVVVTALTAVLPLTLATAEEPVMTRHVVFGTGQVGRLVVEQLVHGGAQVVAVNRTGRANLPGAEVVGGDATDPAFTTRVTAGADVVYFCLNAVNYARWAEEFPPLQQRRARRSRGRRRPPGRPRQPLRATDPPTAVTSSRPCRHTPPPPRPPPGRR